MPFVVVQYKGKTMRTSTAEGSNPTWNEQIVISSRLVGIEIVIRADEWKFFLFQFVEPTKSHERFLVPANI